MATHRSSGHPFYQQAFDRLYDDALACGREWDRDKWFKMLNPAFYATNIKIVEEFEQRFKRLSQVGTLVDSQKDPESQQSSSCP